MKYKKTISRKGKKISKPKKYNKMSKKRMKYRKSHSKKSKKSKKSQSKKSHSKKSHSKKSFSKMKRGKKTKMRIRSGAGSESEPKEPAFHTTHQSSYSTKEVDMLMKQKVKEIQILQKKLEGVSRNSKERTELEKKINNSEAELNKLVAQLEKERKKTKTAKGAQASAEQTAEQLKIDKNELLKKIEELEKKNEEESILTDKQKKQLDKLKKNVEKAKGDIPWKKVGTGTVIAMATFLTGGEIWDYLATDHVGSFTGHFFSGLWDTITMHGVETARHAAEAAA